MPSFSCVHKHLLPFDWDWLPCPLKYFDIVSVCFHVPVLQWSLQFLLTVFTFLSLILCCIFFCYLKQISSLLWMTPNHSSHTQSFSVHASFKSVIQSLCHLSLLHPINDIPYLMKSSRIRISKPLTNCLANSSFLWRGGSKIFSLRIKASCITLCLPGVKWPSF